AVPRLCKAECVVLESSKNYRHRSPNQLVQCARGDWGLVDGALRSRIVPPLDWCRCYRCVTKRAKQSWLPPRPLTTDDGSVCPAGEDCSLEQLLVAAYHGEKKPWSLNPDYSHLAAKAVDR